MGTTVLTQPGVTIVSGNPHTVSKTTKYPEQSYQFFRALKDHKVETELVIYPREGHGPNEKMHLLDLARRIPAWFEKYLLGASHEN